MILWFLVAANFVHNALRLLPLRQVPDEFHSASQEQFERGADTPHDISALVGPPSSTTEAHFFV